MRRTRGKATELTGNTILQEANVWETHSRRHCPRAFPGLTSEIRTGQSKDAHVFTHQALLPRPHEVIHWSVQSK